MTIPRIIVAGSRGLNNDKWVFSVLDKLFGWELVQIISGGAAGADRAGERWARRQGLVPTVMKPDYDKYPKKQAPKIRNGDMAEYAMKSEKRALVLFWDGKSRGSKDMLEKAYRAGIEEIHIYRYRK